MYTTGSNYNVRHEQKGGLSKAHLYPNLQLKTK